MLWSIPTWKDDFFLIELQLSDCFSHTTALCHFLMLMKALERERQNNVKHHRKFDVCKYNYLDWKLARIHKPIHTNTHMPLVQRTITECRKSDSYRWVFEVMTNHPGFILTLCDFFFSKALTWFITWLSIHTLSLTDVQFAITFINSFRHWFTIQQSTDWTKLH